MLKHILSCVFYFLLSLSVVDAENMIRLRGMQPSPLLSKSAEQGVIKSGSNETDLKTNLGESQSIMLSYWILGIGTSSITTSFNNSGLDYILKSEWMDVALLLDGPGNTSFTFGQGIVSGGEGSVSDGSSELIGKKVSGTAFFAAFGLEYVLPLNLDFIGLKFTEILLGYRENKLEYKDFKNNSSSISSNLKFKSVQYQFGVGLVF